ncbi:hypothetical protein ONS95_002134 [Cadophora gregata]|uniref:uncharacterized protein n=1 Tax=Cadophora gregata TaxID=51156 RepID=UPI0026DA7612|nr:uncharacterized protein ONS95_002134 [Cadophora gregata]KAK0109440.1 hypothetical protein ONS95_002134 [Cadophora gregata]KAK0110932.1 hypothetical protein ONS96_002517 [Cadophora gregata f. sp. sojae]
MRAHDPNTNVAIISSRKNNLHNPGFVRSAAPSPSVRASPEAVERSSPSITGMSSSHVHQRARSAAPSPSTHSPTESRDHTPSFGSMVVPSNVYPFRQRARSSAPSPSPSISMNLGIKSENIFRTPTSGHQSDFNRTTSTDLVQSSQHRHRPARERSNAPSPSPTMDPAKLEPILKHTAEHKPVHKNEFRSRTHRTRVPAPRTFRSSAPSPDRSLSMSYTPPAGAIPPTNTPTSAEKKASASAPNITRTAAFSCSSHRGLLEGISSFDDSEDDEEEESDSDKESRNSDGDEYELRAGDAGGYDPENDPRFKDIYCQSRSSVTNTVTVTNTYLVPAPTRVPPPAPTEAKNPTRQSRPSQSAKDKDGGKKQPVLEKIGRKGDEEDEQEDGRRDEDEDKKRRTWNPPHAPKAMQSHQITWINDKKVGERINGVQVSIDEDEDEDEDEVGGRGRNKKGGKGKGLSGKLGMGRKGGQRR